MSTKKWNALYLYKPISVNLSSKLFQSENLITCIEDIIRETKVLPQDVEIEITESILLHDIDEVNEQLQGIRDLGLRVSMDDFGAGYSSIGLLDRIPLDTIKLDRLFTLDIHKPSKQAIIKSILIMAETLGLDVIVEGVETEEQLNKFIQLGCYIVQGYYFYAPLSAEAITTWLEENQGQLVKKDFEHSDK